MLNLNTSNVMELFIRDWIKEITSGNDNYSILGCLNENDY